MIAALLSAPSFSQSVKQTVKSQLETNDLYVKLSSAKDSKSAKKQAKADIKDGWKVMSGEKPLERQYTESEIYSNLLMTNIYGTQVPRYIAHTGMATGKTYNMAYTDAREQCKYDIAGMLETQIVGSITTSKESQKLSDSENMAVEKLSEKVKTLVNESLTNLIPVVTTYRMRDGNYEVRVRIACDKQEIVNKLKMNMLNESSVSEDMLDKLLNDAMAKKSTL